MNKITGFLKEVYQELTKVTWLPKDAVIKSTIAVGVVVTIVAIYISLVDLGLSVFVKGMLGGR
ncbi:MAG: preprotein translocase subunit SecE [Elusimicrobiota bacterium]|jgi:preprotein translocase SecE subunit